jgi:predicted lactoylglutathione lyase
MKMKKIILIIIGLVAPFAIGFYANTVLTKKSTNENTEIMKTDKQSTLKLGAFSISLSVKDLKTSKEFYEKLGFTDFGGSMEQNYLIMKNENALIGLFQGMFQGNILTFNPGWDENASNLENFDDIRKIQKELKNSGLTLTSEPDDKTEGPASLMLTDPDGNVILIDQHR